jgi:hypothetical protein
MRPRKGNHVTTTRVSGTPGAHASALGRQHLLRSAAGAAAAIAGCLAAFLVGVNVGALFPLLAAAGAAAYANHCWQNAQRAWVGARSEKRVAKVVNDLGARTVVHGALLGAGGDADHLVVGPILAVIETKTGRGKVKTRNGHLTVGGRQMPGDPIEQARRQAAAASKRARRNATPIVCVVDMTGRPMSIAGVTVCSLGDLPKVLKGLPRPVDPPAHDRLISSLKI